MKEVLLHFTESFFQELQPFLQNFQTLFLHVVFFLQKNVGNKKNENAFVDFIKDQFRKAFKFYRLTPFDSL